MDLDHKPYKIFKSLKGKYSTETVLLTEAMMAMPGVRLAFKDHRAYVAELFKRKGVEVYRFTHDYQSLDTAHPQLGLVYLANDSVINPGVEVWALIEHNARRIIDESKATKFGHADDIPKGW